MLDLRNVDCLKLMREIGDKTQHLIISDPPYFEVKGDFDFVWASFDDYLKDVEKWAVECKRILADNGTLLWWGNSKKIAYSQIILDKYFNLENSIIWQKKDSMQYQYYSADTARVFNTHNERLLMYSNEVGRTGLQAIMEDFIWEKNPFGILISKSMKENLLTRKDLGDAILKNGYKNIQSASAQISNFCLGKNIPTLKDWEVIVDLLKIKKDYKDIRKDYEDIRKDYEDKRRFFKNENKLDEVFTFFQESHLTKQYSHPTKKAPSICRALINTCSRKGQNAFIPFGGSGVEVVECLNHGLNVIASEINVDYYELIKDRIKNETNQIDLFK